MTICEKKVPLDYFLNKCLDLRGPVVEKGLMYNVHFIPRLVAICIFFSIYLRYVNREFRSPYNYVPGVQTN
jgi:hypothetical protein